jgi:hypothetical protein
MESPSSISLLIKPLPLEIKEHKYRAILIEIITQHLPQYRGRLAEMLANWRHYNIEHLVEIAMCHVGGTTFVDDDRYDNSDYSDTKTGSIRTHDSVATITGVVSSSKKDPKSKEGDLRVVMHNQFDNTLHYYFFPKKCWEERLREHGDCHSRELRSHYNRSTDTVTKWSSYRVASFRDLALMPSTITAPGQYVPPASPRNTLFEWAE